MKKQSNGFEKDQLRRMKYASVESKFNALANMVAFAKEAQRSCMKRGVKMHPLFSE